MYTYGEVKTQTMDELRRTQLMEFMFSEQTPVLRASRTIRSGLKWAIMQKLIPAGKRCPRCASRMYIHIERADHYVHDEHMVWQCRSVHCRRYYHVGVGTVFGFSKQVSLIEQIRIMFHYYPRQFNAHSAARELMEYTGFWYEKSVNKIFKLLRTQIHNHTQNYYRRNKLGRLNRTVEIDESIFATKQDGSKTWVLGFYERGSREYRAIYVPDRTENTLTRVILENVQEGAEVVTDFWRGYNGLKHFYRHKVLNKAKLGYGTSEWVSTNQVESMWAQIKNEFQKYTTVVVQSIQPYLDEALWRIRIKPVPARIKFLIQLNSHQMFANASEAPQTEGARPEAEPFSLGAEFSKLTPSLVS